jgi:hypothetical protein
VRVSTLWLVDLAGSENAKMTNATGDRAKEAKFINQSLLTLSLIIQKLSEGKRNSDQRFRSNQVTVVLICDVQCACLSFATSYFCLLLSLRFYKGNSICHSETPS